MPGMIGPCGGYRTVQDEGVDLTRRRILDFVGAGVTATDDAAGERTLVTIPGAGGGGALTQIADTTLGADAANITFSSIAQTYNHLLLVLVIRSRKNAANDQIALRYNADSTGSYYYEWIEGVAASVAATESLAQTSGLVIHGCPADTAQSNRWGVAHVWIPSYAVSANQPNWIADSFSPRHIATGGVIRAAIGGIFNTQAAVSTVAIISQNGSNLTTQSRATLYGLT